jgi:hypothetical protein
VKLRFRISLRLFLLIVLLCTAAMGWFAVANLQPYREEAEVTKKLMRLGGEAIRVPREPNWFWRLFGEEIAQSTEALTFSDAPIGDTDIEQIGKLTGLKLIVVFRSNVTDAGLAHLRGLDQIVMLKLQELAISSPPIQGMTKLVHLDLSFTNVSALDTSAMASLELLDLGASRADDRTLASFAPMPRLKTLNLSGRPGQKMDITDRGLALLSAEKFPKLSVLRLYETKVTEGAIKDLVERFPNLSVFWDGPSPYGQGSEPGQVPAAPLPDSRSGPAASKKP